jgi:hypothetical protein
MKAMILFGFITMSCAGKTGKVIPAKAVQSEEERQHDIDAAPFDQPIDDKGNRTALRLCLSPEMDSGKFQRTYVEDFADGTRRYTVELNFEKKATETFQVSEPRIGEAAYQGVSEQVIIAYGLNPEARYQIALLGETVTVRIIGGRPVEELDRLGFPPASCGRIKTDI